MTAAETFCQVAIGLCEMLFSPCLHRFLDFLHRQMHQTLLVQTVETVVMSVVRATVTGIADSFRCNAKVLLMTEILTERSH